MFFLKSVHWLGNSKEVLREFPDKARKNIGYALHEAQLGAKPAAAKPLKGFGGAQVLEVIEDYDGDTYRAVYTVKFADVVYVLHVFQKKSKHGIATPQHEINLIKNRLKTAEQDYKKE